MKWANPWFAIPACLLAGLVSCASTQQKLEDDLKKPGAEESLRLVGRVASIPADRRFVLIQSYGKWGMEAGTILTTRGPEERAANLLVTGESLGQYAAADLQSGAVEVGDGVYWLPKKPLPAAADAEGKPDVPGGPS